MTLLRYIVASVLIVGAFNCSERIADNPGTNKQPKTQLWLFPDSTIGVGISRQHLRWWGEDPDGLVRGYLFAFVAYKAGGFPSPDTLRYTWVTKNDSVMQFPLDTLFRYFTVFVRAVDNTFDGLPKQSIVRLHPSPYHDTNNNGVFDGGDVALPTLRGAMDPAGASLAFPIKNTPPTIAFLPNPNDPSLALRQPDFTFTVATFGFKGSDFDGDNTLANYRIALNDTSNPANWLNIPLRDTVITLVVPRARSDAALPGAGVTVTADVYGGRFLGRQLLGQLPGLRLDAANVFYVQVKDVAGEFSQPIRMPSSTGQWLIKRPRGKVLLVSDYTNNDAPAARSTYLAALAGIPGGGFTSVDTLNIAFGLSAVDKNAGKLSTAVPPYVDPALINTFLLYDYVFWYTDQFPTLGVAQLSLFTYLQNGGKVLFSTTFSTATDPRGALRDFAPIDSISSVDLGPSRPPVPPPVPGDTRIPANFALHPDSTISGNIYPRLAFNSTPSTHVIFMRDVYRRADARYLYRLQPDTRNRYKAIDRTSAADTLRPKIAVVDGQGTIIFFGLPLHLLNNTVEGNPEGLTAFFTKIFTQEFSPVHRVNRKRF